MTDFGGAKEAARLREIHEKPSRRATLQGFYHLRGGFYLRRNEAGTITLRLEYPNRAWIFWETTVTPEEFASAVAAVSTRGENGHTWRMLVNFLKREA